MTTQPEALRLADAIDPLTRKDLDNLTCAVAAAELRRLAGIEDEWMTLSQDQNKAEGQIDRLEAQRDALLKMLKDVLPVAEDASESLGRFCGDEGWVQEDMDRMDNVDGMLPLIRAAIAAVEGEKT